jgi:hypothetical protein
MLRPPRAEGKPIGLLFVWVGELGQGARRGVKNGGGYFRIPSVIEGVTAKHRPLI